MAANRTSSGGDHMLTAEETPDPQPAPDPEPKPDEGDGGGDGA
jgi:hypothetical protein